MDTEKKKKELILHVGRIRLLSRSLSQLSNVNRSLERLVTEGCGQIDTKLDRVISTIEV